MYPSKSDDASRKGWELSLPIESSADDQMDVNVSTPARRDLVSPQSDNSGDVISRLSEAMANALRNITPAVPGPSRMVRGDVLSKFNPEDVNQNIEDWCRKVDEVRCMFGWTEDVTIFNALSKLEGLASVWYKGLRSINYTWDEWKIKLKRAFPAQRDFSDLLEETVRRKKRSDETFAQYFYEKQALLNACKIQGKDAVSCIIGGISDSSIRVGAKAANCQDPEELFDYLRSLNEEVKTGKFVPIRKPLHFQDRKRRFTQGKERLVCYNCNKRGHTKRDCPGNKSEDRPRKCFVCQEVGHMANMCPKRRKVHETK